MWDVEGALDPRTGINKIQCPGCGTKLDSASRCDGDLTLRPGPGDWTLCVYCQTMLIFDETNTPVLPTQEQLDSRSHLEKFTHTALQQRYKAET